MKTGKRGVIGGINITPLTDIFLVLLIIMMLLPIIEMKELQLNIRPASSGPPPDPKNMPKTFDMKVLADHFTVQKVDVDAGGLAKALAEKKADFPDGLVIDVSPDSRHEQLAQALSAAKTAGIAKVAVRRMPSEKKGASSPAPSTPKNAAAPASPEQKTNPPSPAPKPK